MHQPLSDRPEFQEREEDEDDEIEPLLSRGGSHRMNPGFQDPALRDHPISGAGATQRRQALSMRGGFQRNVQNDLASVAAPGARGALFSAAASFLIHGTAIGLPAGSRLGRPNASDFLRDDPRSPSILREEGAVEDNGAADETTDSEVSFPPSPIWSASSVEQDAPTTPPRPHTPQSINSSDISEPSSSPSFVPVRRRP